MKVPTGTHRSWALQAVATGEAGAGHVAGSAPAGQATQEAPQAFPTQSGDGWHAPGGGGYPSAHAPFPSQ